MLTLPLYAIDSDDDLPPLQTRHVDSGRMRHPPAAVAAMPAADVGTRQHWGRLYRALGEAVGAGPDSFQLLSGAVAWDWPRQQPGFIDSAQYDFCSTLPAWSAVAAHTSAGDRVHRAYQHLLNIVPASSGGDGRLRAGMRAAEHALCLARQGYVSACRQARAAYLDAVAHDLPGFTTWLGSAGGRRWQSLLASAGMRMHQAQSGFDAQVVRAGPAELATAQNRAKSTTFHAKLDAAALAQLPRVPNWSVARDSAGWCAALRAGRGPAGASLCLGARDAPCDYARTWAGRTTPIQPCFWEARIDGVWQPLDLLDADPELELQLDFQAVDWIGIQPDGWYSAPFVRSAAEGPFRGPYSVGGGDRLQAVFGCEGFFALIKTGMYVGYRPSFTVMPGAASAERFAALFRAATGLRIGPLLFEAGRGAEKASWHADPARRRFSGCSTSDVPMILGVSVAQPARVA